MPVLGKRLKRQGDERTCGDAALGLPQAPVGGVWKRKVSAKADKEGACSLERGSGRECQSVCLGDSVLTPIELLLLSTVH